MARKIGDVMTRRPVVLPLEATLAEAARLMRDHGIGDVLVTSDGRLCGMVTDRDIVVRAVAESKETDITPLAEVCSAEVITVAPDDDTDTAAELMRRRAVRRLPVVNSGRPVGIISIGDLAMEAAADSAGATLADISKAPPTR